MTTPRRRATASAPTRRALDPTMLLAVALPLATVLALMVTRTEPAHQLLRPPAETALTSASLACPSGWGDARVLVTTTGAESGPVTVRRGAEEEDVEVARDRATPTGGDQATVVRGEDALAPGLAAGRVVPRPLAATDCRPAEGSVWFTGVGAGARHRSVLELVNPGEGPAVADVEVLSAAGPVDAPQLQGILVPEGGIRRVDLAVELPRRDDLALHVITSRGRLAASVVNVVDRLGRSEPAQDWLPAQVEPASQLTLLGLPPGPGARILVLANPGSDEVRVDLRLVTPDSVFAPQGLREVRLPPHGLARLSLSALLRSPTAEGATGLRVEATGPVTAGLRAQVGDDVAHAAVATPVSTETAAMLPVGRQARLVLADASAVGVVAVTARDESGRILAEERIDLAPDRGAVVDLPRRAVLVTVRPQRLSVAGVVTVSGTGSAVVRLPELQRAGLVPDVRPGLP